MKKIQQKYFVILGLVVLLVVFVGVFVGFTSPLREPVMPQRILTAPNSDYDGYVKVDDFAINHSEYFYYPNPSEGKEGTEFQKFILIRLHQSLGGSEPNASSFRAYSALDLTSHCYLLYWPYEGRYHRLEDPCISSGYRVYDGASMQPVFKNQRGATTGALPKLDLSVDKEGYLIVNPPTFTLSENGVVGIGRDLSIGEMIEVSKILLDLRSNPFPKTSEIPLKLKSGHFLHYSDNSENVFRYFNEQNVEDYLSVEIMDKKSCNPTTEFSNYQYEEGSFGVNDKTVFYKIRDDDRYWIWMDFCSENYHFSMESNIPLERLTQIITDDFISI